MPLNRLIAREGFDGTDVDDVDGRALDGAGAAQWAVGTWTRHPGSETGRTLAIRDDEATTLNGGLTQYLVDDIPSLPDDYAVAGRLRFPGFDTPTEAYLPPCAYFGVGGDASNPDFTIYEPGVDESVMLWFRRTGTGPGTATFEVVLTNGTTFKWFMEFDGLGRLRLYTSFHKPGIPPFPDENATHLFFSNVAEPTPNKEHCYFFRFSNKNATAPHFETGDPQDITQCGAFCGNARDAKFLTSFSTYQHSTRDSYASSFTGDVEAYPYFAEVTLGGPGAYEYAYGEVAVRLDPTDLTGYWFGAEFEHPNTIAGGEEPPRLRFWLYEGTAGTYTLLRPIIEIPWFHDDSVEIKLEAVGAVPVLRAFAKRPTEYDWLPVFTFDVATDDADETAAPVAAHATGHPGADCYEESVEADGRYIRIEEWSVYVEGDPCTGPPENPYPEDPPPVPPLEPAGETPMQVGQWRTTIVPSFPDNVGQFRDGYIGQWVMANGIWRQVAVPEEHDNPPETEFPPYYDPCERLPAPELPPTEPLGDPPERLFFCYSHPITQLGPLFTAAPNALGPWSVTNLNQAAARSSYIIGAQGSYSQFLNPNYSRALMLAWIDSHAAYMATLMASPWFYGVQAADDFASQTRWPPSGLDVDELSYIIAYWKTKYPGIRVGLRARPAQFSPSNYPANLDFVICQYRYWGGLGTPAQFFDRELALAVTRGWDVLWSMNFQNGGTGGTGNPMTPSQVVECMVQFTSDGTNNHGVGGWHYTAGYFATPGVLDAFAIGRNALAALGAP